MNQDEILDKLGASIEAYDIDEAEKYARLAMDEGISPDDAINLGLAKGMDTISRLFDEAKIFLPQILMAAKAMEAALDIIEPYMKKGDDVKLKGVISAAPCSVVPDSRSSTSEPMSHPTRSRRP